MIRLARIQPLTDFLRNHKSFISNLKASRDPTVLTVNGKAEVVIQDAESYQALLDRVEEAEFIAAIEEGLADVEAGRTQDARESLVELRKKLFGLQG